MKITGTIQPQVSTIGRQILRAETVRFQAGPQVERVRTRREEDTQYITLCDLDNVNRLSRGMIKDLHAAFKKAEADPNVKQIVLESGHEKHFCPGADLKGEFKHFSQMKASLGKILPFVPKSVRNMMLNAWMVPSLRNFAISGHWLHQQIANSPKVTIAKINGQAIGGGVELGLACDYVIASEKARFAIPEVKYGIYPDWGATERLPQRVGPAMARFLILEGGFMADKGMDGPATLEAHEAKQIGMIDAVVPAENLDAYLREGIAAGRFTTKVKRPDNQTDIHKLDNVTAERVAGTRLAEKFQRYRTTPLEELIKTDLKGLYPPTIRLNNRRIDLGPHVSRFRLEKDLLTMLVYYAKVNPGVRLF